MTANKALNYENGEETAISNSFTEFYYDPIL